MAEENRVTQDALEAAIKTSADVRMTAAVAEAAIKTSADVRVTEIALEVAYHNPFAVSRRRPRTCIMS